MPGLDIGVSIAPQNNQGMVKMYEMQHQLYFVTILNPQNDSFLL